VLAAGEADSAAANSALEWLCKSYRYPLYVHVRRLGRGPEDAEDLIQQFLSRFIERRYLQRADPQRGRFRSFLLTSLKHFLADEWDKLRALKRGGGQPAISWDGVDPEERYRLEPADTLTPDVAYEKRWARTVLDTVLGQLRAEKQANGEGREFELLVQFVWGDGGAGNSYTEIAAALNLTETAARQKVHRLRKQVREQLREEVARTVSAPEEVDDELRYLRSLLSG